MLLATAKPASTNLQVSSPTSSASVATPAATVVANLSTTTSVNRSQAAALQTSTAAVAAAAAAFCGHRQRRRLQSTAKSSTSCRAGRSSNASPEDNQANTSKEAMADMTRSLVEQLREVDSLNRCLSYGRLTSVSSKEGKKAVQDFSKLIMPEESKQFSKIVSEQPALAALQAVLSGSSEEERDSIIKESILKIRSAGKIKDEEVQLGDEEAAIVEHLQRCMEPVSERLSVGDDLRHTWPIKPTKSDDTVEAQDARMPAIASLLEASRDALGRVGLTGSAPLLGQSANAMQLGDLLQKVQPLVAVGNTDVEILGVVDVLPLVRLGDAALLFWPQDDDEAANGIVQEQMQQAVGQGAVAVIILDAPADSDSKVSQLYEAFEGSNLQAIAALAWVEGGSAAVARAFFGDVTTGMKKIAVVGGDPFEVQTASWLVYTALERMNSSAASVALLGSQRSWIGGGVVDVAGLSSTPSVSSQPRQLTPCIVQELFSESASVGASTLIAQVAPGCQQWSAFSGVDFDLVIDLGSPDATAVDSDFAYASDSILSSTARGGVVRAANSAASESGALTFELVTPEPSVSLSSLFHGVSDSKLNNALLNEELFARGLMQEASLSNKEGIAAALGYKFLDSYEFDSLKDLAKINEKNAEQTGDQLGELEEEEENPEAIKQQQAKIKAEAKNRMREAHAFQRAPVRPGHLREVNFEADAAESNSFADVVANLLPSTRSSSLCLQFETLTSGGRKFELALPLHGIAAARATVAAVATMYFLEGASADSQDDVLQRVLQSMQAAVAPPGNMEVLTTGWPPAVVAIYHEASSPREVRRVLQAVREWAKLGAEEERTSPEITAVLGCSGDMRRGDRAKYGWALADYCDSAVLTVDHPRSEPPMQILEDVLEAVRARTQPSFSDSGYGGLRDPASTALAPLGKVQVVADRTDALKLAITSSVSAPEDGLPGITVVFGNPTGFQEVADVSGKTSNWLHNDRRLVLEIIEAAEQLSAWGRPAADGLEKANMEVESQAKRINIAHTPWRIGRRTDWEAKKVKGVKSPEAIRFPGQSMHWTYGVGLKNDCSPAFQGLQ